jgi:hypothetical protein
VEHRAGQLVAAHIRSSRPGAAGSAAITVSFADWDFTPSSESLDVTKRRARCSRCQAARGELGITVTYRFTPDNYLVE